MLAMGFERDMKIEILRHQLNLPEIDCRGNRKKRGRRKNRVTGAGGSLRRRDLCRKQSFYRLISGWDNPGIFDHQDDRPFGGTRTMERTFGNDESLSRREVDRAALQIDQKPAFDHIEKFVVIVVLVPMVLALDNTNADDRGVHLAERLIEPRLTRVGKRLFVNHLQGAVQNIKPRIVGEILDVAHPKSSDSK